MATKYPPTALPLSGYTATASNTAFGWGPGDAFDGVIGNQGWHGPQNYQSYTNPPYQHVGSAALGGVNGEWIKLELPSAMTLSYMKIAPRNDPADPNSTQAPKDLTILGSNDNSSWTVITSATNLTPATSGQFDQITAVATTGYTYYAVVVTRTGAGGGWLVIGELQFWGTTGSGSGTQQLVFDDQASGTTFTGTLSGNANNTAIRDTVNGYIRVTQGGTSRIGSVYWQTTLTNNWEATFEIYILPINYGGADDMRFIFYATNPITTNDGAIGTNGHGGAYMRWEYYGSDYVELYDHTATRVSQQSVSLQMNGWMPVTVTFNNGVMTSTIRNSSGTTLKTTTYDFGTTYATRYNTPTYVAVTGRSGGVQAEDRVRNITINALNVAGAGGGGGSGSGSGTIIQYPISLNTISVEAGGTIPHGLTELYSTVFSDGSTAPGSGTIRFTDFLSKTIGSSSSSSTTTSYTYGTYSNYTSTQLLPPVMTSTSQSGYTISGIAVSGGTSGSSGYGVIQAFDRTATTNWNGVLGGGWASHWDNNVYKGPSTSWTGVGTLTGPWLRVDLPSSITIQGIVVRATGSLVVPQKLRLLGSTDGTNWNLVFSTDVTILNPGGTASGYYGSNANVLLFTPSASYNRYVFQWLANTQQTGTYLPRLAQFNIIAGSSNPTGTINSFTYGTYSNYTSTQLLPPVMTSTTQYGYTISGHADPATDLINAFDRSASTNYSGAGIGTTVFADTVFINNIYYRRTTYSSSYQQYPTTWTGWGTYNGPWVKIQLPSAQQVEGIVIRSQAGSNFPQKLRLLGSNDGTNWNLLFSMDQTINTGTGSSNSQSPVVIDFGTLTASYLYYAFKWLEITSSGPAPGGLPRLCQFNLII
jgi:hypothetical protein